MKIALQNIKVSEIFHNYLDEAEEGVRGFGGKWMVSNARSVFANT